MINPICKAKVIADSMSHEGIRLTTVYAVYPRYIHAQVLTHRMFSRNTASSRAIPTHKLLDEAVITPPRFGANQPGMQPSDITVDAEGIWAHARNRASDYAKRLADLGVHKQWANRLLEPFLPVHTIITATEWDNFFALRCHADAQEEIQLLANAIKDAMDNSTPESLEPGDWHMPYANNLIQSVARCARVSYMKNDNLSTFKDDELLFDRLYESKHLSPFEHQARCPVNTNHATHTDRQGQSWWGNFRGWEQYRHIIGETK